MNTIMLAGGGAVVVPTEILSPTPTLVYEVLKVDSPTAIPKGEWGSPMVFFIIILVFVALYTLYRVKQIKKV